ncbi:ATP-dependent Clp protease ATP-binding subunit ClpX [compost metagenome]
MTLEITAAALDHIADQALQRKTGARGLRAVLEVALQQTMFDMPSQPLLRVCTLDLVEEEGDARLRVLETLAEADVVEAPADAAPLIATSAEPARLAVDL